MAVCFCFAGGGTGGHLFPGLAVADALRARDPAARIIFAGSDRPLEREPISAHGYAHCVLPGRSLAIAGRNPLGFVWSNMQAYRLARRLLATENPAAVIGLGGFASVPPVLAASRLGIPIVLLEQNVIPGRATRLLCRCAGVVCISFPETAGHLPQNVKTAVTGNPVRARIAALASALDDTTVQRRTLLVLGGSQGASAVNRAMLRTVKSLRTRLREWKVVHQTGIHDWQEVKIGYQELGIDHVVAPFFSDLPDRYRDAGIVASRAGATTLAELACAGCPTICIPYPTAIYDHQTANAQTYQQAGAAMIVKQGENVNVTTERLTGALGELLDDSSRREQMRQGMRRMAKPRATAEVVEALSAILQSNDQLR